IRRDGFPQARPLWGVWQDRLLFLSVGHAGLQRAANPEGAVTVHVDSAVDVVILEGTIERTSGDDAARRAGEAYAAKYDYSSDYVNFVMRPRIAYGWRAEDVKTGTKWIFA
ncbi:MAG: pyridoxamine 5'-phosphate oxidase family protein, partial [Actinomycetota bacterium]